jgi:hypothetical protein
MPSDLDILGVNRENASLLLGALFPGIGLAMALKKKAKFPPISPDPKSGTGGKTPALLGGRDITSMGGGFLLGGL